MELLYWELKISLIITATVFITTIIAFSYGYKTGITANKELKDKTK